MAGDDSPPAARTTLQCVVTNHLPQGSPTRALLSRESHGGSVRAVAAGRPPNLRGMRPGYEMGDDLHGEPGDAASRCPLIFVNLPREQVEVSSGRWMPVNALDALRFILQQARARFTHAVGSRVPVVVNLSYGSTAGSHSGGAMFECALDELLAADEHLAVTLAAGNSRDAESHAQLDVPARRSASLGLFVPPSTPFDTFVEFWLPPKADLSTITVTVTTPEGLEMAVSGSKRESVLEDGFTSTDTPEVRARKRTAALFLFPKVVQATDRTMVTLVVCGTVHSPRRQTLATAGPWRVTVKNGGKSALRVQCWVERDEVGTRRPQAARFFSVKVEKRGFERVIRTTNTLSNLGGTRFDLESQLLGLQGNDAEVARRTRERDLAQLTAGLGAADAARVTAAYDYNVALRQQITETQAAQTAAAELATAQQRAADQASQAAQQIQAAWQSLSDSLFDEVARIRGLLTGSAVDSLGGAQTSFTIATAQARAGDQAAAKQLPALSQALLALAESQATSAFDLARIRGATAQSLQQTGLQLAGNYSLALPSNAAPLPLVPRYQPSADAASQSTAALLSEIAQLREDQRAQAAAMASLQKRLLDLITRWETNGIPEVRSTA